MVLLYDGMADYPVPALNGKTPMEVAKKPLFDRLASKGEVGMVRTVAEGLKPGSDVANLSVMGYDPAKYYTGRSPLEAVSIGVKMAEDDIAMRCNVVTLSDEENYDDKTMVDYSAGDITSEDAAQLIKAVQEHFGGGEFDFYSGVSYRHCLIHHGGTTELGNMTPPHDISGRVVGEYISKHPNAQKLTAMMRESYSFLKDHPVNIRRVSEGKRPGNSIWLWGEGTSPKLDNFESLHGVKGSVISAVDLLKGIFEAPDECGHRNEPFNKVRSIELIDEKVLPVVLDYLDNCGDDYKIMILPDHPTPIVTMTHASDPVPYMIYHKNGETDSGVKSINENSAQTTGIFEEVGHNLIRKFFGEI